jgi:hypothetical protein
MQKLHLRPKSMPLRVDGCMTIVVKQNSEERWMVVVGQKHARNGRRV